MDEVCVVLKLSETPEEYRFSINKRVDPPILHIPGNHRGPDVCIPDKPEQAMWLDSMKEFMTPFWDCQWKFRSLEACDAFLSYLSKQGKTCKDQSN